MFFIIAAIIIILIVFFGKYEREMPDKTETASHQLRCMYGFSAAVQFIIEKYFVKQNNKELISKFEKLYPEGRAKHHLKLWFYKRNSIIIFLILVSLLFAGLYSLKNSNSVQIDGYTVKRPEAEKKCQIRINYMTEEEKGIIEYETAARRMTYNEFFDYFMSQKEVIIREVLNNNKETDNVRTDLYFPDTLKSVPAELTWDTSNTSIISKSGVVKNEAVLEEGTAVTINVMAEYYGEICFFEFPVIVKPKVYSEKEIFELELTEKIKECDSSMEYENTFILPDKVNGKEILWSKKEDNNAAVIVILGIAAAFAISCGYSGIISKKEKLRERQMITDYSEIVSELTLFLEAGLTIRGAFERISSDYKKEKNFGAEKRYAYEEILCLTRMLDSGVSETKGYQDFGRRCGFIPYIRLSASLSQNLKRGTKGIIPMLRQEAQQAFAYRKENAKKLGEEAGTKLLAPMVIYLIIVIVIIVVPAIMSF